MNKKWILFFAMAALSLASCNENMDGRYSHRGILSLCTFK